MKESTLIYAQERLNEIKNLENRIKEIDTFIKDNEFERLDIKGLELNKRIVIAKVIFPYLIAHRIMIKKHLQSEKESFDNL